MEKKIRFATAILDFSIKKGGAERYLFDLCTYLAKEGNEVHVYAEDWDKEIPEIYYHRIKTIPFPQSLRLLSFALRATKEMEKGDYDVTLGVGNTLKADIIQPRGGVHWAWFWLSLRAYDNPFIWIIKLFGRIFSLKQWVGGFIEDAPYKNKNFYKVIAISEMIKKDMIHWYKIPDDRIIVDYNGVDIERFHPRNRKYRDEIRRRFNIGEEFVILFVSNNFRMKGLRYLIMAISKIKLEGEHFFKLLVLGRDRKDPYLRLAKRMGVLQELIFAGSTDMPEKYYGASDILVHPTFYDACSRTVLEAMASGLPVITTYSNGASGILTDGEEGIVIKDPRDIEVLSKSILFFFDKERRAKASVLARQCVEKYSFDRNMEKMKEIFYKYIDTKGYMRKGL